ncbi:MAG: bifunctional metallophosphatase/5'-nucleotidase [bacterium]
MRILNKFTLFLIVVFFSLSIQLSVAEFGHLTILYVNDTHEHILPDKQDGAEIGGLIRMATLVKQIMSEEENVIFLHGGDHITGSVFSNIYHGKIDIICFNYMGLTASCVGNHEFDGGYINLMNELVPLAKFPFISSNIYFDVSSKEIEAFYPWEFFIETEVGDFGMPIVIYGLTTPNTPVQTNPDNVKGLIFDDPVSISEKLLKKWQSQYPVIIAITHIGLSDDKMLASSVNGIDVIIGGHSHDFIYKPEKVGRTIICQAGQYGWYLGRIDIVFDKNGEVIDYKNRLLKITNEIKDDEGLLTELIPYIEEVEGFSNQIICSLDFVLGADTEKTRTGETNLGDLLTDVMCYATNSDVAIINSGGIRATIEPPEVSVGDIMKALPFNNSIILCKLSGSDLLNAFKWGYENQVGSGGFPQISGAKVYLTKDGRVDRVLIGDEPIDMNKIYSVATVNFLVSGGDGYTMFANAEKKIDTGLFTTDLVIAYLKDKGKVPQPVMNRVIIE